MAGTRGRADLYLEIYGGLLAALYLDLKSDLLSLSQRLETSTFNCADVDEDVFASIPLNETVALGGVKPFDGACSH